MVVMVMLRTMNCFVPLQDVEGNLDQGEHQKYGNDSGRKGKIW